MDFKFDFEIKSKNEVALCIKVPQEIKDTLNRLKDIGISQTEIFIQAVKHIEPQLSKIEKDLKK